MNIKKLNLIAILLIISLMIISTGCQGSNLKRNKISGDKNTQSAEEESAFGLFKYTNCDNDTDIAAICYLGYNIDPENLNAAIDDQLQGISTEEFSHIRQVMLDGEEYYLIVPRYSHSEISVYKSDISTDYKDNAPISATSSEAIVLKCNVSDIITNSVVEITYKDADGKDNVVAFSPSISLKDGEISDTELIFEYKNEVPDIG